MSSQKKTSTKNTSTATNKTTKTKEKKKDNSNLNERSFGAMKSIEDYEEGSLPGDQNKLGNIIRNNTIETKYIDVRRCLPGTNIRSVNPVGVEQIVNSMKINDYTDKSAIYVTLYQSTTPQLAVDDYDNWKTKIKKNLKYEVDAESFYSIVDGRHRVEAVKFLYEKGYFLTPLIEATILSSNLTDCQLFGIAQQQNYQTSVCVEMSLDDFVS